MTRSSVRIAIQGESGSNSHLAALQVGGDQAAVLPCRASAEVFEALVSRTAAMAVLPIENSLHGSVAEHYDLMLAFGTRIIGETRLPIRHNLVAAPGVTLAQVKRVISHPVALSQCRLWFRAHPGVEAVPFYDTAGAVKHLMANRLEDTAAISAALAAQVYGADLLETGIEDHVENYTRFLTLVAAEDLPVAPGQNKISVVFALEHRPGTLVTALEEIGRSGLDLTKIESRPVPGRPWEYLFFVDAVFTDPAQADGAMVGLKNRCRMLREMGRYAAAV